MFYTKTDVHVVDKNFNVENNYKYFFFSIGNKILILEKSHDVTVQDTEKLK